jgi:vacuolar protein sorting-associated protein 13A/C
VELFGLKLKPDALQQLNLPIEVVEGHLGELRLQIPWTSLRSKPVILHIKDLCVLAGPRSKFMYDPAREVERALRTKLSKLETYELVLSSAQSVAVKDENKTESFFAHLTSRVISNIQVHPCCH